MSSARANRRSGLISALASHEEFVWADSIPYLAPVVSTELCEPLSQATCVSLLNGDIPTLTHGAVCMFAERSCDLVTLI